MSKILIVEDDEDVLESLTLVLKVQGHTLETAMDGAEALDRLKLYDYDLVVLDINLPKMNGHEVLRQFRSSGGTTAVLMLTAQDGTASKVQGLDGGADDYLVKPFVADELTARIRALLRRHTSSKSAIITCGPVSIDTTHRKVTAGDAEITLLPKEYALLEFFIRHQGQYFSAETLLERVWSSESDSTKDTVRVWIKRLRDKLGADLGKALIRTEAGVGYVMSHQGDQTS